MASELAECSHEAKQFFVLLAIAARLGCFARFRIEAAGRPEDNGR
jgi:hypothetical protein